MRISDWSSGVCSSDLSPYLLHGPARDARDPGLEPLLGPLPARREGVADSRYRLESIAAAAPRIEEEALVQGLADRAVAISDGEIDPAHPRLLDLLTREVRPHALIEAVQSPSYR